MRRSGAVARGEASSNVRENHLVSPARFIQEEEAAAAAARVDEEEQPSAIPARRRDEEAEAPRPPQYPAGGHSGTSAVAPDDAEAEAVFQHMAKRKLERELGGTYQSDKPWVLFWTMLTLLLLFGLVAPSFVDPLDPNDSPVGVLGGMGGKKKIDIQINIRDLGFLSLMAVIATILLVYTLTKVVVVVRWSLYWLLATMSVLYLWKGEYNLFSADTPMILLVAFGVLEFLTFSVYIVVTFIYPRVVSSEWFRRHIGVARWWSLRSNPDTHPWTYTYVDAHSLLDSRRTCTYRGETDAKGLPHGFGHWLDDSFHGELLSGVWERGKAVGPFRSREFGSGFAFESLRIGFVHCSDDAWSQRAYFPRQTRMPTLGVASVECSVAGGFFSHLPRAELLFDGPHGFPPPRRLRNPWAAEGAEPHCATRTIADVMLDIKVLYSEHPTSSLIVTATHSDQDGPGVSVSGHTFVGSETIHNRRRLIIDLVAVEEEEEEATTAASRGGGRKPQRRGRGEGDASLMLPDDAADAEGPIRALPDEPTSSSLSDELGEEEASSSTTREGFEAEEEEAAPSARHRPPGWARERTLHLFDPSSVSSSGISYQLLQQQQHLLHRPRASTNAIADLAMSMNRSAGSRSNGVAPSNLSRLSAAESSVSSGSSSGSTSLLEPPAPPRAPPLPFNAPHLRVRAWKSTVEGHVEALIFFPGFNASLEHAVQRLGQFVAMGRFPPHVRPFVFAWPCARELTYQWAKEIASSEKTQSALAWFLQGLAEAGVRDVHFLVHSLGAQVVTSAFADDPVTGQRSEVASMFREIVSSGSAPPRESPAEAPPAALRLRTLTLLNPDVPLSKFVRSDFGNFRRVCDRITVIGDRKDGALEYSELGNGLYNTWRFVRRVLCGGGGRRLAPHPASAGTGSVANHEDLDEDQSMYTTEDSEFTRPHPHPVAAAAPSWWPSWGVQRCCRRRSQEEEEEADAFAYEDVERAAPPSPRRARRPRACARLVRACWRGSCRPYRHAEDRAFSRVLAVGRNIFSLYASSNASSLTSETTRLIVSGRARPVESELEGAPTKLWLDLDAIDTSSMESNVHTLRHAYFDLNKILVEDLVELIVTGKRAAERSLLLHREGNIFSFCQAPSCVVNP